MNLYGTLLSDTACVQCVWFKMAFMSVDVDMEAGAGGLLRHNQPFHQVCLCCLLYAKCSYMNEAL